MIFIFNCSSLIFIFFFIFLFENVFEARGGAMTTNMHFHDSMADIASLQKDVEALKTDYAKLEV